jgi:hypothetical protein|tara:strand:+ start:743 stop:871 length:129 start_codon:yes stop_codon:yes gene_type:complete
MKVCNIKLDEHDAFETPGSIKNIWQTDIISSQKGLLQTVMFI